MKSIYLIVIVFLCSSIHVKASHAMPLVNYSVQASVSGFTVSGNSDPATCGGGPYWMETIITPNKAALGKPATAAVYNTLLNWSSTSQFYIFQDHYYSLLNVPNYNISSSWPDNCSTEPYADLIIPFSTLCPGTKYYIQSREAVMGTNTYGTWSVIDSIITPGVAPVPFPFSVNSSANPLCSGQSATLTATGGTYYFWNPPASSSMSVVVSPSVTTIYTVVATDSANCASTQTFSLNVNICTSIESQTLKDRYSLYPNPVVDYINITGIDEATITKFKICNILGTILKESEFNSRSIDVSELPHGVYFLILERDKKTIQTSKFIK